jgi:predicted flap endonuclease-1-like 5' DNA nuclease
MFARQKNETELPGWLWFFLILPLGLAVALLYRRNRLQQLAGRLRSLPQALKPAPRYVEPDSIPLEIRPVEPAEIAESEIAAGPEEISLSRMETAESALPNLGEQTEDLKIIEGIGPSIAALLGQAGISTFHQLAETSIERLREILSAARLGHLADPATWPEQARLAEKGQWDELKQLQDTLSRGRRQTGE